MITARVIVEILAAAVISGASCAAVGFLLANLRLPFLGVTMSHAALAGAVFAKVLGLPIFPPAFAVAIGSAFAIGPLADKAKLDSNLAMGIVFSLSMGVAFLGIGLTDGPKTEMLDLIWGSILLITTRDVIFLGVLGLILFVYLAVFEKEIKAVLFSRTVAASVGVREAALTYSMLIVTGAVVTACLESVGGLLLFALLSNPVAAATRVFDSYMGSLIGSAGLGALSAVGGLGLSWVFNLPAGASIALVSGIIFIICIIIGRLTGKS